MASNSPIARVQRLQAFFLDLHAIVSSEGRKNLVRSTSHILAILGEAEENPAQSAERVAEARSFYRSMSVVKGEFAEFHIWRDDFNERLELNKPLEAIRESIRKEFELDA
jgi:hypothetical protein